MSFRYHLVSLLAVLLALGGGIVVGSAAVGPTEAAPVTQARTDDGFVDAVGPRLIKGALAGQRVLVLLAPDASAAGLPAELTKAGATVTAQLRLRPSLLDADGSATVDDVVARVVPAGVDLPDTGAVPRAAAVLAAGLTGDGEVDTGVYGGLSGAGLVAGTAPTARATVVLLLTGASRGPALADLAEGLQQRAGVVAAGPAVTPAVAELRRRTAGVSDVDGLGDTRSAVAVVLALAEQAGGGAGHYGSGAGATAVVP